MFTYSLKSSELDFLHCEGGGGSGVWKMAQMRKNCTVNSGHFCI